MFSLTRIIILIALSGAALEGAQARPFATRAGLNRRSRLAYRSQTFEPSLARRNGGSPQDVEACLKVARHTGVNPLQEKDVVNRCADKMGANENGVYAKGIRQEARFDDEQDALLRNKKPIHGPI